MIIGLVVILLFIGGALRAKRLNSALTSGTAIVSPSPAATTAPAAALATGGEHYAKRDYLGMVGFHLGKLGQLAPPMNASCTQPWPPPPECTRDIAGYRGQLLAANSDLATVSAPSNLAAADQTLRSGLAQDLQATAQAQTALAQKNQASWWDALAQHGQAGAALNRAYTQALDSLH